MTSDSITCWPPTKAGEVAKQPCPAIFGATPVMFAYKRCELDGSWAQSSLWKGFGHSDYSECVGHLSMIEDVFGVDKEHMNEMETEIVVEDKLISNVLLAILIISLVFLVVSSVVINCAIPRKLNQSPNYKIWKHFILAVIFETLCRSVLEVSKLVDIEYGVLANSPFCEALITIIEYMNMANYMWFMIQTHNQQLIARSGRLCTSGYITYILVAWGISAIPIAIWSVTASLSYKIPCWYGYNIHPIIWIVETPRLSILLVAIVFLVQAFCRMSKNSEMLNINCCYRRLYLESIGSSFYLVFVLFVSCTNALLYTLSSPYSYNTVIRITFQIVSAMKGTVLSMLLLSLNTDVRALLERNVRRISRQELVPSHVQENEL